jgi:hypothetical protein
MWNEPCVSEKGGPTRANAAKRRWSIMTDVRWPWKSASANQCVTTQRPNGPALKIDETHATTLLSYRASCTEAVWRCRVGRCRGCHDHWSTRLVRAAPDTDLGSSSNNSDGPLLRTATGGLRRDGSESRCGEGFLAIGVHARFSRS